MEESKIKSKSRFNFILITILVVLLGFLAGISGEFFARYYLSNFNFFRDLYFTDQAAIGTRDIVINEPKKVVVEQDLRINQIKDEVQTTIMKIYKKKKNAKNLLEKIYLPDDYLGQAVNLTSDGWLMATKNILIRPKDSVVVDYNQQIYEIDKVIEDEATGVVFIKISAQNLSVARLADFERITNGEQIVIYNNYYDWLNLANIQNKRYQEINNKYDFVSNTQILDKYILLNKNFTVNLNGTPAFNFQSEFVGFLLAQDGHLSQIVPINYISPIINQVLKGEKVKRPYLGLNYINIAQTNGLEQSERQNASSGVMIWPNDKGLAITKESPLFGLLNVGDIIIAVEDQSLDVNSDLTNLLLQYKSGQEIRLKYLHEQKEAELSIVLK